MIEKSEREQTIAYECKLLADRKNEENTLQAKVERLFKFITTVARTQAALGDYEIPHLGTLLHIHSTDAEVKPLIEDDIILRTLPMLRESGFVVTNYMASDITNEQMRHGHHQRIAWSKPTKFHHAV